MTPSISLGALVLTTLIPVLIGAWFLRRGIRGYRRGETPYYANCSYNLTGLSRERCPECGAVTAGPGAVVHGERKTRRGLIVIGLLCLMAAGVWGWSQTKGWQIDWYHYKPISWVLNDLKSPNGVVANKAWTEIQRARFGPVSGPAPQAH